MNNTIKFLALTLVVPTAALGQQPEPESMPCCQRDADGNMSCCESMQGEDDESHGGMDHGTMNHDDMNHGNMDHDSMDHGDTEHPAPEAEAEADPTIG